MNGSCVSGEVPPNSQNIKQNPLCSDWKQSSCVSCASRAYFDVNRICQKVSDNCNTWDKLTGECLTCYKGYDLNNGSCVYSALNTRAPEDAGCRTWNNGVCTECSTNWVFNVNGLCIPVSDLCKTFDKNGQCLTCYYGYDLVNGSCVYS